MIILKTGGLGAVCTHNGIGSFYGVLPHTLQGNG